MCSKIVRSDMGQLASELAHRSPTPVGDVNVFVHVQSILILAEIGGSNGGQPPYPMKPFHHTVTSDMSMNGQNRHHGSIAAYTPAGLLVLYVLIRILF